MKGNIGFGTVISLKKINWKFKQVTIFAEMSVWHWNLYDHKRTHHGFPTSSCNSAVLQDYVKFSAFLRVVECKKACWYAGGWWGTTTRRSISTSSSTPFIFTSTPSSSTRRSERQASLPCSTFLSVDNWLNLSTTFFGGLECVGHSFAYVAHFVFLGDVWIRTQRAAVASKGASNLATHLPTT